MSIGNVSAYFQQTAMVLRATQTTAVTGATINAWTTQAEVKGCLRPYTVTKAGGEHLSADKMTVYAGYKFYSAPTTSFDEADILRVDGVRYRVRHIADVMSMGRLMQTELELVGHDTT